MSTDGGDVLKKTKPAKTIGQQQLRCALVGVIFSLYSGHLLRPRSVSAIVTERGRTWAVIGPPWLRPPLNLLTPTSEMEVGAEGQRPVKPRDLSDDTAAER
ncbi:hypothetical protein XENORESO_019470 [Xenotaenia resolanae]|uniref:Uncharacterized protein n=1 Tax=Xenotaenia resolanae TaxID=208358 RepID=A0ABV0WI56_9TELE